MSNFFINILHQVPVGTSVLDEHGKALTSLEGEREYYIAARGGAGGKGNQHFASSTDTTPRYAEEGGAGEHRVLYLEMKTMAHAGLVNIRFCMTEITDSIKVFNTK